VGGIIDRLYWAAKTYFSSYGIAWFDLDLFEGLIRYIHCRGSVSVGELNRVIPKLSTSRFARTGREGYYFARLLWYLGVVTFGRGRGGRFLRLSSLGLDLLRRVSKVGKSGRVGVFRGLFLSWYPLYVFLKYLSKHGPVSVKDVVRDLGGCMRFWTSILYDLGIGREVMRRRGVAKPFNEFVVTNFFIPLATQLGLIEVSNRRFLLRREFRWVIDEVGKYFSELDIIRTMPGDYTIYAAITDVLYDAKEPVIISPWVNGSLINIVEGVAKINKSLRQVRVVVRPTKANLDIIKQLKQRVSIDIETYCYRRLHAKIVTNPQGPSLTSSANIIETNLKRNYEIGTYYPKTPPHITQTTEQLINTAQTIQI